MLARLLMIVAVVTLICVCVTTVSVAQNDANDSDKAILDLMMQKRDTLQARADVLKRKYEDGTITLFSALGAQGDLLEAELSLARSPADRIALRETQVANMKEIEDYFRQCFETGTSTTEEVLNAKAERLEAEIVLLREKVMQQ